MQHCAHQVYAADADNPPRHDHHMLQPCLLTQQQEKQLLLLLLQAGFIRSDELKTLRSTCINMVLGTDMKKHFDIMSRFQVSIPPAYALKSALPPALSVKLPRCPCSQKQQEQLRTMQDVACYQPQQRLPQVSSRGTASAGVVIHMLLLGVIVSWVVQPHIRQTNLN